MAILDAIQRWAEVSPERTAHVSGDRSLSYGELARRSDRLANYFLAKYPGVEAHRPIAIYGHKEPEMLIAFLAAAKSGHPYVPIDVSIPDQRIERILETCHPVAFLTARDTAEIAEGAVPTTPIKVNSAYYVGEDDPFYIMFTSGSTGEPKGVVITYRNLQSFVNWMVQEQQFVEQGEVFLDQAPFSFDLSVMDVYPCLVTGNTLFSLHKDEIANPAQLYRTLTGSPVTTWVSTPSFARLCLVEKRFTSAMLPRLNRFLFCGETLSPDTASALLVRFPQASVWNTYGPTEATVATTSIRINEPVLSAHAPLPVGYPKLGSRLLIVDEADRPLPDGQHGEIIIAGPNVSAGYSGRPDLTEKAFFDLDGVRAYRTGDQGYMQHGLLFFEGRRDNQIKLHGHRIEIGDVEANLQALPHVRDALVVVKMKDGAPDSLTAFVIDEGDDDPAVMSEFDRASVLRTALAGRLPDHMIPRRFYFVDSFPLTTNGKADRKKLAEMQR